MAKRNSEKIELLLGLNSFNQPAEASGKNAWIKLVTNLLFMKKGTYPSDPNMGGELYKYEFAFIDDVIDEIRDTIRDQVQTYLPDIPLTGCDVSSSKLSSGKVVLLISLTFRYQDGQFDTAVVAAENVNNQINFAVAM